MTEPIKTTLRRASLVAHIATLIEPREAPRGATQTDGILSVDSCNEQDLAWFADDDSDQHDFPDQEILIKETGYCEAVCTKGVTRTLRLTMIRPISAADLDTADPTLV